MPWQDRIKPGAYTSPSGVRTEFQFEDLTVELVKKTTEFTFPDSDGSFVQDLGRNGLRLPITAYFTGDNYDIVASEFLNSLGERGAGKLEHPLYGTFDVVPFGSITRSDALVNTANQASVNLTFLQTIKLIYPTPEDDPAGLVSVALREQQAAAAEEFSSNVLLDTVKRIEEFKAKFDDLVDTISDGLQAVAEVQETVANAFEDIENSINALIDAVPGSVLAIAFEFQRLINAPARAIAAIGARLDAYGNLLTDILGTDFSGAGTGGSGGVVTEELIAQQNEFRTQDLAAASYVAASAVSVINTTFETRQEALDAAVKITDRLAEFTTWRERNFEILSLVSANQVDVAQVDTGTSYEALHSLVTITAGFLVQLSFTLKQEQRLVLDRDRTVVDLVAELYGRVDDELDFFIQSNQLTGSEILELPRGREIVFYV